MRVQLYIRKSFEGQHSIENVFHSLLGAEWKKHARLHTVSFYSKGILARLGIILECFFKRGKVNHITGDITFSALSFLGSKRTIVTFHDFMFLQIKNKRKRAILKFFWLDIPVFFSKNLTTVSEYTKAELLKYKPNLDPNRIKVIHNPVHPVFEVRPNPPCNPVPKILLVGTNQNKNLKTSLKALSEIHCFVVILGIMSAQQKKLAADLNVNYLNLQELPLSGVKDLYHQCDLLLFPSTCEGFGLPVVEAQTCGLPVIAGNNSALPEIAGDGAIFVEAQDPYEIRLKIEEILNDSDKRKQLVKAGFENAKRFNHKKIKRDYLKFYDAVGGQ